MDDIVEHVQGWQNACHIPFRRKSVAGDSIVTCEHMYYTSVLTSGKEWCCRLLLHVKILILAINIWPGLRCSRLFSGGKQGPAFMTTSWGDTSHSDLRAWAWMNYFFILSMNYVQNRLLVDGKGTLTQTLAVGYRKAKSTEKMSNEEQKFTNLMIHWNICCIISIPLLK